MSNSIKDTIIYDYLGEQIYPYTNISSIKIDGYTSTDTPSTYNWPIHTYITDCVKEYNKNKYVDLSTAQTVNGDKTFNGNISFTNIISGTSTKAKFDTSGNNIAETFDDISTRISQIENSITDQIDLANYSGAVKLDVSASSSPAEIIGDLSVSNDVISNTGFYIPSVGGKIYADVGELSIETTHALNLNGGEVNIMGTLITGSKHEMGPYILEVDRDHNDVNIKSLNEMRLACATELSFNSNSMVISSQQVEFQNDVTCIGNVHASGFYESSDERLKTFKSPISIDLDKLSQIRKSHFIFNEYPTKEHIGVSAQEIQKLYPEIVIEGESGTLKVDYSKLSVIALAAIDKLHEENIQLKNRLDILESKLK